ncbi:MAG: hypothetical protein EXS00_05000 [Phycisphaerales bacterium]|nr:hypothetical protein [Phycisphaerales bacterium]
MLRFAVYDQRGPARQMALLQAHTIGASDVPVRSEIVFDSGIVECRFKGAEAAALELGYEVGDGGRLMLQTCLLEQRSEPYHLALEIARNRIKIFIAKAEEWLMWDHPSAVDAIAEWDQARQHFTHAMTASDPLEAERFSHKALISAVEAAEKLAVVHSETLLSRKYGRKSASGGIIGVRIDPSTDPARAEPFLASSGLLIIQTKWSQLEPSEGALDTAGIDRWIHWAAHNQRRIVIGPLMDFSPGSVPPWAEARCSDFAACRDLTWSFMERLVKRYHDTTTLWIIASGLNTNERFGFSLEQMVDLTRRASLLVRQSRNGACSIVEIIQPFAEDVALRKNAMTPIAFVEALQQEGIRIDALGVQFIFGEKGRGRVARDLMQVSSFLDRLVPLDLPVMVTGFAVPSGAEGTGGGRWHGAWCPELQANWCQSMLSITLGRPWVESAVWSQLFDSPGDGPRYGLVSTSGTPRPVCAVLGRVLERLRKPVKPAGKSTHSKPKQM